MTKKRVKSNNLYLTLLHVNEFDLDTKKDTKLGIVKQKSGESCRYDDDYSSDGYGGGWNFYNNPKLWPDYVFLMANFTHN